MYHTKPIDKIIIHCSATRRNEDVDIEDITSWHIVERGWRTCGYHYVITLGGDIQIGRPHKEKGAHCKGQNDGSIGVCFVGGLTMNDNPADTRTFEQKIMLKKLIKKLRLEFGKVKVHGHNEFSKKDCPCFDVSEYNKISKIDKIRIKINNVRRKLC